MKSHPSTLTVKVNSVGPLTKKTLSIPLGTVVSLSGPSGSGKSTLCRYIEAKSSSRFISLPASEDDFLENSSASVINLPPVFSSTSFRNYSQDTTLIDILQLRNSLSKVFAPLLVKQQKATYQGLFEKLIQDYKGKAIAIGIPLGNSISEPKKIKEIAQKVGSDHIIYNGEITFLEQVVLDKKETDNTVSIVVDKLRISPEKQERIKSLEGHLSLHAFNEFSLYQVDTEKTGKRRYHFIESIRSGVDEQSVSEDIHALLDNPYDHKETLAKLITDLSVPPCSCKDIVLRELKNIPKTNKSKELEYIFTKLATLSLPLLQDFAPLTKWGELSSSQKIVLSTIATLQPSLHKALYLFDEPFELLDETNASALLNLFKEVTEKTNSTILFTRSDFCSMQGIHSLNLAERSLSLSRQKPKPKKNEEEDKSWNYTLTLRGGKTISLQKGLCYKIQGENSQGKSHLLFSEIHPALKKALSDSTLDSSFLDSTIVADYSSGSSKRRRTTSVGSFLSIINPLAELFTLLTSSKEAGATKGDFSSGRYLKKFTPHTTPRFKGFSFNEAITLPLSEIYSAFRTTPLLDKALSLLVRAELDYLSLSTPLNVLGSGEVSLLRLVKYAATCSRRWILMIDNPHTGLDKRQVHAAALMLRELRKKGVTILYTQQGILPDLDPDTIILVKEKGSIEKGKD
jgi:ABC-type Mn2+/Zn2+ transport system ATPase subunit